MKIDGKAIAAKIQEELRKEVAQLTTERKPKLTVLLVGDNPASAIYVKSKTRKCQSIGMESEDLHLPEDIAEDTLLEHISDLNNDPTVDGILVQLPLPEHISEEKVINTISPEKDVDGFHPVNVGKMLIGADSGFLPCTPNGIKVLLTRSGIDPSGKHVVIIGRSNIVGKPTAAILIQKAPYCNATVTIANSRTENLTELCRRADILVAAIGRPHFLTEEMVKEGAVIIDVGINRVEDPSAKKGYRIVGDADYDKVKEKCSAITPVPGGVGPMTIAMLLTNTLISFKRREEVGIVQS